MLLPYLPHLLMMVKAIENVNSYKFHIKFIMYIINNISLYFQLL